MAELPTIVFCKNVKGKINLADWLMYLQYSPAVVEVPTGFLLLFCSNFERWSKQDTVWVFKILRQIILERKKKVPNKDLSQAP